MRSIDFLLAFVYSRTFALVENNFLKKKKLFVSNNASSITAKIIEEENTFDITR